MDQKKVLTRLVEVTRNLSTMVDLETYLQSILSAAAELTESETASLMEYDEAAREFFFKFVPWFHRDALKGARVPLEGSAAGWVFQNIQPLILDDVKNEPRYYVNIDNLTSFETRSLLCVPLIQHGRPMGVLEAVNKFLPYTEEDILVLETLASLATTAMQTSSLEASRQASQNEARELERLKNDFIAITSHELRTPLGLILGHSTFLKELVGAEHQEQVDTIIRNASRLKEIIESLSSMDNQQSGTASLRAHKVSVSRLIEDVAASFRDMAIQKGVALKIEKDPNQEMSIEADSSKIAIALSNLVKNAITFTNRGGQIIIRGAAESDFVKVSVEDNGIGIPPKDQPHIFDRFYQVESHLTRRHGGMGLGLSVAKAMIEMHHGKIWVESAENVGSRFFFTLPIEAESDLQFSSPFIK